MKDKALEIILIVLESLVHRLGFGLVPLEDAEALANTPIPYKKGLAL